MCTLYGYSGWWRWHDGHSTNKHSFPFYHRWKPMRASVHPLRVRNSCLSTVNYFPLFMSHIGNRSFCTFRQNRVALANTFRVHVLWFIFRIKCILADWASDLYWYSFVSVSLSLYFVVMWFWFGFWRARIQKHHWNNQSIFMLLVSRTSGISGFSYSTNCHFIPYFDINNRISTHSVQRTFVYKRTYLIGENVNKNRNPAYDNDRYKNILGWFS